MYLFGQCFVAPGGVRTPSQLCIWFGQCFVAPGVVRTPSQQHNKARVEAKLLSPTRVPGPTKEKKIHWREKKERSYSTIYFT